MTKQQFEIEKNYQISLMFAKLMLEKGIIKDSELRIVKKMLIKKYKPIIGSI